MRRPWARRPQARNPKCESGARPMGAFGVDIAGRRHHQLCLRQSISLVLREGVQPYACRRRSAYQTVAARHTVPYLDVGVLMVLVWPSHGRRLAAPQPVPSGCGHHSGRGSVERQRLLDGRVEHLAWPKWYPGSRVRHTTPHPHRRICGRHPAGLLAGIQQLRLLQRTIR